MTVVNADRPVAAAAELSYERTVHRRDVHRWALSEVFLTDVREGADGAFAAAAQLPTSHVYYGDHTGPADAVDSVLLMECCRQAATYLAHHELGVARDSAFMVSEWSLDLTAGAGPDTAPGAGPAGARHPGRLSIGTTVAERRARSGVVRSARFLMRLHLDGRFLGTADISAKYIPAEEAAIVRSYRRKTVPPLSTSLAATPAGTPVPAASVGRRTLENVALYDAGDDAGAVSARVAVPSSHATHFDHPQDHYTAMTLMEAARQLALLALDGAPGGPARVAGYRARFLQFAELDSPVVARTVPAPVATTSTAGVPGSHASTLPVVFRQDGSVVAEIAVTVADRAGA